MATKFFIISGYCGPDNYTSDNGPILQVSEVETVEQVERCYKKFIDNISKDYSHVTFRVIEGVEKKMIPVEIVTKYKLV